MCGFKSHRSPHPNVPTDDVYLAQIELYKQKIEIYKHQVADYADKSWLEEVRRGSNI